MTTTTKRNFLGIPVDGNITHGATRRAQRPIEELQPLLQAVVDDPTIVEFGWRQYTPYFNDGEPCTFSVYGMWVRVEGVEVVEDEEDPWDLELDNSEHALGRRPYRWNADTRQYDRFSYEGPDEERYERVHALDAAIQGGEFENVLLEAFGDHAAVTVRRDGIEVEFYEHD